jgi:hypothetical protein
MPRSLHTLEARPLPREKSLLSCERAQRASRSVIRTRGLRSTRRDLTLGAGEKEPGPTLLPTDILNASCENAEMAPYLREDGASDIFSTNSSWSRSEASRKPLDASHSIVLEDIE